MENLGLFLPENSTELVPRLGIAGHEGLSELMLPTPANFRAASLLGAEQHLTQPLDAIELPGTRETDSRLPTQDLDLAPATTRSTTSLASVDVVTGQAAEDTLQTATRTASSLASVDVITEQAIAQATLAELNEAVQATQRFLTASTANNTSFSVPRGAYFVSPNGENSNRGTQASPWRTLEKAIDSAPGGSTIVLRGGTYREGDLRVGKKLTLQPYLREEVWIKGSLKVEGWNREGDLWRKDNWNYRFESVTDPEQIDRSHPLAGKPDAVFIDGRPLTQVAGKAQVGPGEFYVDYSSRKLYIGNNPSGRTLEATAFERAFSMGAPSRYSVVRGLNFAHYAEEGIQGIGSNLTFKNNTFVWNSKDGLFTIDGANVNVQGNTFSNNGYSGLRMNNNDRALVEKNTARYNNNQRFSNFASAGMKINKADYSVVRNNTIEDNFADGLWFDVFSKNVTIVRNIARQNQGNGIFFEKSRGAIIASNLLVRNGGYGIAVQESAGAEVWNNTLSKNAVNIAVRDGERVTPWQVTDNTIKNNILSNVSGKAPLGKPFLVEIVDFVGSRNQLVSDMDYNAYYRRSSRTPEDVIRKSPGQNSKSATSYRTVANFRSATRFEDYALGIDNVPINPFFIDEGSGNYRLKLGSLAIKRGQPLPGDIARAIGVQAGVRVNLGALRLPIW